MLPISPAPSLPRSRRRSKGAADAHTSDEGGAAADARADEAAGSSAVTHHDARQPHAAPHVFARRQLRLSPEASKAVAALQAAAHGEALSPRAASLLSSTEGLFLGIRWRWFGRHAYCASRLVYMRCSAGRTSFVKLVIAEGPGGPDDLCVLTRRHSLTRAQTGTDSHEPYSGDGSTSLRCSTAAIWCCTPTPLALWSCTLAHYASRSGRCWAI
jgi:hypothetical protein